MAVAAAALMTAVSCGGDQSLPTVGKASCEPRREASHVARLRGFLVHDGVATSRGELILVGERVTPNVRGVVLGLDGRGVTVLATFPDVLHLWSIVRSRGRFSIVGDLKNGRAFIAEAPSAAGRWSRLRVPAHLTTLTSQASTSHGHLVAGQRTTDDGVEAVVLERRWRTNRYRPVAVVAPALNRAAHFREVVALAGTIVAAGFDGVEGVIVAAGGDNDPNRVTTDKELTAATGAALTPNAAYVTGSVRLVPGQTATGGTLIVRRGRDTRWHSNVWHRATYLTDVAFASAKVGYVIGTDRRGTLAWMTTDGGRSWMKRALPTRVSLERLIVGCGTYAVGPAGVVRIR